MYNDEDASVAVGDKLMETLLINPENIKKYGDLRSSLINSITQGKNFEPTSKAVVYTMLFKYVLKSTKRNTKLTET